MVLLLAPSATVRVLANSTVAAAYSFTGVSLSNDTTSAWGKKSLPDYILACNFPWSRRRGRLPLTVCAVSRNEEIASFFNVQLSELGRKLEGPLAIAQSDKGLICKKALENGQQADETGAVVKTVKFASVDSNNQATWKRSPRQSWESSSSSFDAPPQVPVPPFTGGLITSLGLVLVFGVILDRWIFRSTRRGQRASRRGQSQGGGSIRPEALGPQLSASEVAMFLRRDLKKKESVEWVNMVLGKLWKVYRLGLEGWLMGLLQPLIDNLQKPAYVERVLIRQFSLGSEPISVRSVQRRASRRSNDLQ